MIHLLKKKLTKVGVKLNRKEEVL